MRRKTVVVTLAGADDLLARLRPGVGVKFDDSGAEHEARMNKLLSLRDRVL